MFGAFNPGLRQPLAVAGAVIALTWVVIAIFAPLIAPSSPLAQNFPPSAGPSWQHLFGTDELGRDVLSRVIYGARVTLPIGLAIVLLAATVGAHDRRDLGLLPRAARRALHARDRPGVRVPADHPRDGRSRRPRPQPRERGPRDRHRGVALRTPGSSAASS